MHGLCLRAAVEQEKIHHGLFSPMEDANFILPSLMPEEQR